MRLYIVRDISEDDCVLVVANNAKEAKKIGLPELDSDYIGTSVNWIRNANISNVKKGVYTDYSTALKNGWFGWVYSSCPVCNKNEIIRYDEEKEMFYCIGCKSYFEEL